MAIKIICPRCGKHNELEAKRCWGCNRDIPLELAQAAQAQANVEAEAERAANEERDRRQQQAKAQELAEAEAAFVAGEMHRIPRHLRESFASRIPVSTSPFLYGQDIAEVVDVVTAECAFGMNVFKDIFMDFRDFFGGRSETVQKAFRDARKVCLTELRKEALVAGGNAVVSVSLAYNEISGGGKMGMLFLVASGTAVKLKPMEGAP